MKPALLHRIVAAVLAIGAAYHAAALVWPALAEAAPAWRHGLFVAINAVMAAGMLLRPRAFTVLFAALALQQMYSHGSHALSTWSDERRIDWASAFVLVAIPIALGLLVRAARRAGRGHDSVADDPSVST